MGSPLWEAIERVEVLWGGGIEVTLNSAGALGEDLPEPSLGLSSQSLPRALRQLP